MLLNGGRLYDEGQYGCIFTPPLLCKNQKKSVTSDVDNNKLDKLLTKEEAITEFAMAQTIQKLPLWKNYFIVSESMCEPAKLQQNSELAECDLLDTKSLSQLRILRMTFGGTPLSIYKSKVQDFPYMDILKHMLEGVSLLTLHGVIHRDLHQGNILIDSKNVPRIIDFNLSLNVKNNIQSSDLKHTYTVIPFQEPPDSTLINAILLGKKYDIVINDIIDNKPILRKIQSVLGVSTDNMRQNLEEFYERSISVQNGDYVKWFKTYWRVVDSWAVGTNFVELANKLLLWNEFQEEWRKISKQIVPILKKMCAINPMERIDCIQALAKIDPQNYIIRKYATEWLNNVGSGF